MDYDVIDFMYYRQEDKGFIIDRPEGISDYLFLHFVNPVDIRVDGQMIRTAPHACIIFTPYTPHYYTAVSHEMLHDWVHFIPLTEKGNMQFRGIPINKIFYTDLGSKITNRLEKMQWWRNTHNALRVSNQLMEVFEMLKEEYHSLHTYDNSGKASFDELRTLIYQTPKNWTIALMAKYVHMSRSYFSTEYKSIFGISPVDDLCSATILTAQKMLTTTNLNIQIIALNCGYDNLSYFIRKFKKETGLTPNEYRKRYC